MVATNKAWINDCLPLWKIGRMHVLTHVIQSLFNLCSTKPAGYPILIQITIHPLSTDGYCNLSIRIQMLDNICLLPSLYFGFGGSMVTKIFAFLSCLSFEVVFWPWLHYWQLLLYVYQVEEGTSPEAVEEEGMTDIRTGRQIEVKTIETVVHHHHGKIHTPHHRGTAGIHIHQAGDLKTGRPGRGYYN